ncbi:DMT family transporter [Novipirellula artificiosorum]|uniref:EamA-like transporter family protein n=1 Tax=Novipirellula artificiosorum TaxID=2528016 RepID=A0A5C6DCB9_9BACT|nr:DMT family transporter [Novipirellula artificiosorum]TWU33417.1 EamA-like transporter family protein [Novipirellula artificiosorum]
MNHPDASTRDYLKLHFIILMWGFTGVLGELIDLPAIELVWFRCVLAACTLAMILRSQIRIERRDALRLGCVGAMIGLHWVLFFLAVKISNVSVCMVGMATTSLWTAILEPLMLPAAKFRRGDLVFGFLIILAVAGIVRSELDHSLGFAVAIASAIVAAIFSILNSPFAKRLDHRVIAFYEMIGAALFCGLCFPVSAYWLSEGRGLDLRPGLFDSIYLVVLAVVCTVYAFSQYVELLKRMSVFTINFANNLEPVYGMLMGALLFADYQSLGVGFYAGAVAIAILVLLHTKLSRRKPMAVN